MHVFSKPLSNKDHPRARHSASVDKVPNTFIPPPIIEAVSSESAEGYFNWLVSDDAKDYMTSLHRESFDRFMDIMMLLEVELYLKFTATTVRQKKRMHRTKVRRCKGGIVHSSYHRIAFKGTIDDDYGWLRKVVEKWQDSTPQGVLMRAGFQKEQWHLGDLKMRKNGPGCALRLRAVTRITVPIKTC